MATFPTLAGVYEARRTLSKFLPRTPLVRSRRLSQELGCEALLKLENLQPVGSFKVRGGIHFACRNLEEARRRGIVTASTGNHAQSIGYAGSLLGIETTVVMPEGIAPVKVEAVRALGASVITRGKFFEEAYGHAEWLSRRDGGLIVHPVEELLLYEGVGTMHLEVLEEFPEIDMAIQPIGGGSGAGSACVVYKGLKPRVEVIGVQAEGAPAFYNAWTTGKLTETGGVTTKAEGLATSRAYGLPLEVMKGRLDGIVLVSDEEMEDAIRRLVYWAGQVAELAGAAAVAAAFKLKERLRGKRVVLPITGGNIQPEALRAILSRHW